MSDRDLRKSQRIAVELPMKLIAADGESFIINTWDFSDKGVFLPISEETRKHVHLNSIVHIQFQGTDHTPPVLSAKVVRVGDSGIGIELKDTIIPGDAPE